MATRAVAARSRTDIFKQDLGEGLWKETPPFFRALGLCPALAVTTGAVYGMVMGLATAAVLMGSAVLISLVRGYIPREVRIPIFAITVATLVTVTDLTLSGFLPDIHRVLGIFVPLIICNCMIMGRIEGFASRREPGRALTDAVGYGLGFTWALALIGAVREILGAGRLFGMDVMPEGFVTWGIMMTPPGAFLTMGLLVGLIVLVRTRREEAGAARQRVPSIGTQTPAQ